MTFRNGHDGWMSHWYDRVLPVVSNVSHDELRNRHRSAVKCTPNYNLPIVCRKHDCYFLITFSCSKRIRMPNIAIWSHYFFNNTFIYIVHKSYVIIVDVMIHVKIMSINLQTDESDNRINICLANKLTHFTQLPRKWVKCIIIEYSIITELILNGKNEEVSVFLSSRDIRYQWSYMLLAECAINLP